MGPSGSLCHLPEDRGWCIIIDHSSLMEINTATLIQLHSTGSEVGQTCSVFCFVLCVFRTSLLRWVSTACYVEWTPNFVILHAHQIHFGFSEQQGSCSLNVPMTVSAMWKCTGPLFTAVFSTEIQERHDFGMLGYPWWESPISDPEDGEGKLSVWKQRGWSMYRSWNELNWPWMSFQSVNC